MLVGLVAGLTFAGADPHLEVLRAHPGVEVRVAELASPVVELGLQLGSDGYLSPSVEAVRYRSLRSSSRSSSSDGRGWSSTRRSTATSSRPPYPAPSRTTNRAADCRPRLSPPARSP